ncbi:MAG: phosphomannomutase/phosphoglucomutase [Syntrophomonadaceae bacterium]|jgi:phosphomannomutase/phosphoglucomutase|nr:phosphomannomutase/phosphoglucomutase [Syntrophomonadaceae bacterium]
MKNIFRQYDIRGVVDRDLDDHTMDRISRAFASMAKQQGYDTILVGRDNRLSSPRFRDTVVSALQDSGCNVIDLGLVITPMFYFASRYLNIPAGIMITASHNGGEYNGCKLLLGESTIYGEQIQEIRRMVESASFTTGGKGSLKFVDISDTYQKEIKNRIEMGAKKLKIVVDCGNGTAGLFAPEVFRSLGCEVIELYCESDPNFPHHHPDPVNPDNMVDLIKAVQEHQADLGLGIDGDGDRLGVVDSSGNMIWGDLLMILFWRDILPRYPDSPCIVEVKCSQSLIDEIVKLGGQPLIYKTGHSLIKAKMKECGAIFTGEMSGHMFFADEYYGFDDAVYAGARLLALLSRSEKSITEMLADINIYYATPEIRVASSDNEKFHIVERVKECFKDKYPINDIDGARITFPDGWALVRASNTGPELIVRCEGKTPEILEEIKSELHSCLQNMGLIVDSLQACQV